MFRILALFLSLMSSTLAIAGKCTASSPEEFASFYSNFADDKSFSMERTRFPLHAVKWEYGMDSRGKDESTPRRFKVSKEKFAAMPSISTTVQAHGLISRIRLVSRNVAVVELFKEGSDWFTSHHFKRIGNCWSFYEYRVKSKICCKFLWFVG